jgi:hypothetical protein
MNFFEYFPTDGRNESNFNRYIHFINRCKYLIAIEQRQYDSLKHQRHHIIPRKLEGVAIDVDFDDNLIVLTFREHLLAHKILWHSFPLSRNMVHAIFSMCNNSKHSENKKLLTSREYAKLKYLNQVNNQGENHPNFGKLVFNNGFVTIFAEKCPNGFVKGQLPETIDKSASKRRGRKASSEHRLNISKGHKGKIVKDSTKKLLREKQSGKSYAHPKYEHRRDSMHEKMCGKNNPMAGKDSPVKGRHWFTNGVEDGMFDKCPDGWWSGRVYRKGHEPSECWTDEGIHLVQSFLFE